MTAFSDELSALSFVVQIEACRFRSPIVCPAMDHAFALEKLRAKR